MNNLKQLYVDLIETLIQQRDKYLEEELTIFSACAGNAYNGKIMIVGRAVNGWNHHLIPSSEESIQKCILSLQNALMTENLDWVKEQWGNTEVYNTKKSAFWRVAKAVSATMNPDIQFHTDSIVWTNLYKASKEEGGNPSGRLMNVEFEICKQILDTEIDLYKPSHIIFLTGLGWATHFLPDAKVDIDKTWNYVEQVGSYRGSKYIVGKHPQGKNELLHVNEIKECFH